MMADEARDEARAAEGERHSPASREQSPVHPSRARAMTWAGGAPPTIEVTSPAGTDWRPSLGSTLRVPPGVGRARSQQSLSLIHI